MTKVKKQAEEAAAAAKVAAEEVAKEKAASDARLVGSFVKENQQTKDKDKTSPKYLRRDPTGQGYICSKSTARGTF